jgi:hypothetical protein
LGVLGSPGRCKVLCLREAAERPNLDPSVSLRPMPIGRSNEALDDKSKSMPGHARGGL